MVFQLDNRLESSCVTLGDLPLCRVLFKDNVEYPWVILVPREKDLQEIIQLPKTSRYQLMDEIAEVSTIIKNYFNPDKLNIATLGNSVQQLHVHIVARFSSDNLWPHGIWQSSQTHKPYLKTKLAEITRDLRVLIGNSN